MSIASAKEHVLDANDLAGFEEVITDPRCYLSDLVKRISNKLTEMYDEDNDLVAEVTGHEDSQVRDQALAYVSASVASTYDSILHNGPDWLHNKARRIHRIPERLVQNESAPKTSTPRGKQALMSLINRDGYRGRRDKIKRIWERALNKGVLVDFQYVMVRFLASRIMSVGESITNRSWEGRDEPEPESLVEHESHNPYFRAWIRNPSGDTLTKYPSFYRITCSMRYPTPPGAWDEAYLSEMLRDLSLFEGLTPTEGACVGREILDYIYNDLEFLPRDGSPVPRHAMLSRVFYFLIESDSLRKNWYLSSYMCSPYPGWNDKFVVPSPPGLKNDIQFFGFDDDDVGECTTSYMQEIFQASFSVERVLGIYCGLRYPKVRNKDLIVYCSRHIRSTRILKSKNAIAWASGTRRALKKVALKCRGSDTQKDRTTVQLICSLLKKTKFDEKTGPRPYTRAAAFLRAVVHARLTASGETLVFN